MRKGAGDATMDVGDWLRSLGPQAVRGRVSQSEIEPDLLPDLSDQNLKDLGVSLGHRIRMLKAIRELGATAESAELPDAHEFVAEPASIRLENAAEVGFKVGFWSFVFNYFGGHVLRELRFLLFGMIPSWA